MLKLLKAKEKIESFFHLAGDVRWLELPTVDRASNEPVDDDRTMTAPGDSMHSSALQYY